MSIAVEIGRLKELLDCGAISPSEFQDAKRGLLQNISAPAPAALSSNHFHGKWRMQDGDGSSMDLLFKPDGTCLIDIVDISPNELPDFVYRMMGLGSNSGKWIFDNHTLRVSAKLGNGAMRFVIGLGDKKAADDMLLDFSIRVNEITEDTVSGIESGNIVKMWRLK